MENSLLWRHLSLSPPVGETMRQLMLVWSVQPILSEEFTSGDVMIKAAMELVYEKGYRAGRQDSQRGRSSTIRSFRANGL
jgi:hypothetical protein